MHVSDLMGANVMVWNSFFLWRLQGGAASFNYLSKSSTFTLPGVDDAEGFKQTLEAMRIVGLSEEEREAVMQIVACVLHLGNIEFECNDDDEAVPADDASWTALGMASVLLQVDCYFQHTWTLYSIHMDLIFKIIRAHECEPMNVNTHTRYFASVKETVNQIYIMCSSGLLLLNLLKIDCFFLLFLNGMWSALLLN